jgi:fatty-acid desaturase
LLQLVSLLFEAAISTWRRNECAKIRDQLDRADKLFSARKTPLPMFILGKMLPVTFVPRPPTELQLHNYYNPPPLRLLGWKQDKRRLVPKGEQLVNFFERDRTFREPISKLTTFFMVAFHIGAIAALFMFTWKAFFVALALWWIAGSLGIGMAYHRLLTHRGFKTYKWVEYFLTLCATLALEGGPFFWVAIHRVHHQNTDVEGDPHSPRDGGFWSHMGWIITGRILHNRSNALLPYIPDLRKDKFHTFISQWHWVPITILGFVLLAVGGWSVMFWGIFLRTVVGLHATWLVNSATHMWGSQRFLTADTSKNSFWVAILTFGEGWHNNHHAHPQAARHGLAWYEIDLNWYGICALRALGLVWDVKAPKLKEAIQLKPTIVQQLSSVSGDD